MGGIKSGGRGVFLLYIVRMILPGKFQCEIKLEKYTNIIYYNEIRIYPWRAFRWVFKGQLRFCWLRIIQGI
jgi:hypothetical protein